MSILRKKTGQLVKVSSWSGGGEGKKQNKIKLKLSRDKDYVSFWTADSRNRHSLQKVLKECIKTNHLFSLNYWA